MKKHRTRGALPSFPGIVATTLIFCWTVSLAAQEPSATRIEHADKEPQNWLTFYGNYRAWSYSPLDHAWQRKAIGAGVGFPDRWAERVTSRAARR